MKQVEDLKLRAEQQERHVRELTEELSAYRQAASNDSGKSFEPDEHHQALQRKREKAQKLLDALIRRMRETSMITSMETETWRISERAEVADEADYLLAPIVSRLSWGFVLAVVGGLLSVSAVRCFSSGREPTTATELTNF